MGVDTIYIMPEDKIVVQTVATYLIGGNSCYAGDPFDVKSNSSVHSKNTLSYQSMEIE